MEVLVNEIQHRIPHQPLNNVRQRSRGERVPPKHAGKDQLKGDRLSVFCLSVKPGNRITNQ